MDTKDHPGKGLSLPQLVFALNEELKDAVRTHSPFLTFDDICRLDRGVSAASLTIREWRNSLVNINRIPPKVLTLIAMHLESQSNRFRATFVCRHWRRTFLQHPALWSQLYLRKGEVYMKAILERAKGSALDIVAFFSTHVNIMTLLLPHTKQIRSLDFSHNYWGDLRRFSELDSEPLPLLRTLKIDDIKELSPDAIIPPSLLFGNAMNLQEFRLETTWPPPLNRFIFPNLTSFELSVEKVEGFRALQLLNFLEASPMLQTVQVKIIADILFNDVPRERAIVLPDVKSLSLVVSDGGPGYDLVTRISCPSVKKTTLTHEKDVEDVTLYNIFPAPALWDAIVRQYTRSPVEKITLEVEVGEDDSILKYSLTFEPLDATVFRLYFKVTTKDWSKDEADFETSLDEIYCGAFSEACRIIRDLPLLANVKRLYIYHTTLVSEYTRVTSIANEVGRLFKSLGPLEELTLRRCDMRPYFTPSVVFPPIKKFTILHPMGPPHGGFEAAIVGLAESQHALGVPFKKVIVRMEELFEDEDEEEMEERLRPWVSSGNCAWEKYRGD